MAADAVGVKTALPAFVCRVLFGQLLGQLLVILIVSLFGSRQVYYSHDPELN